MIKEEKGGQGIVFLSRNELYRHTSFFAIYCRTGFNCVV